MIHKLLHNIKIFVIIILKYILYFFPKNKKIIIFTAWFGEKYADNSMYVFEYMLNNYKNYYCYWLASNKNLYNELKSKGIPVLYSKSFKAKWKQLRASVLLSSVQLSEYNPYFLTNVIYIDLGHGHSIKCPGDVVRNKKTIKYNNMLKKLIDYNTVVCFDHFPYNQKVYDNIINNNNLVKLGFARNDIFYDSELRSNKNQSIKELINGKIVISYLPTHRSDGKELINVDSIFDLEAIEDICNKYNAVFLIKKHFYHRNERSNLTNFNNIIDITNDNSIDTQVLLSDTNILISDYSACFIDYLLLDRPIILYQYDYDTYISNERELLIPFDKIKISSYPKNKNDFSIELERILKNSLDDGYSDGRKDIREEYFCSNISKHVREDVSNFIIDKISKK